MPKSSGVNFKKTIFIISVTLLLLLGASLALFFVGKSYSENILNEVIKRETNGFYWLDFESLDLDLFESRINISQLQLKVDSTKDFNSLGISNIYEIQLNELIIDLESIYALYWDKELIIKSVKVVDPNINMIGLETKKKTKFSFEAGSMYRAISDYLKVLKIDYFRIQDGELEYGDNQFSLGEIDFLVKNLVMDTVSRENQVLYSEQIELEIRNQLFHLPDSIHEITFDKFVLSTSDSILSFENLRISPTKDSKVTFEGINEVNVYDIHIPKLSLKGVDYVSAYQNNHLVIEELIFDGPTVFIDDESHAASTKDKVDNSLLSLIFQIFGSLDIGKLNIKDAHVDIKIDGDTYQRFKVEKSDIVFHDIHLDTSNYRFDHRFKYFEDIELDIHNYTYLLPDSIHRAYFEHLQVNSFDSELVIKNVNVSHERSGNSANRLVDVNVPSLRLKNIDFQRAIVDKVLNVGTFQIANSSIGVINAGDVEMKSNLDINAIYSSLAPFFREISIDQFNVEDLSLSLPKSVQINEIDLFVDNVNINAAISNFQDLFKNANIYVKDLSIDQDSVRVLGNQLYFNQKMAVFQLYDWELEIDKANQLIKGRFDTLQISEVVIDSLINGNYTFFTRATLINPDVNFELHSKSSQGNLDLGIEKELIIKGGKLNGLYDSTMISMEKLNVDVFVGDSTAFRSVGVANISISSREFNHLVELKKWSYDTLDSQMKFDSLTIVPFNIKDTLANLYTAFLPYVRITAFEQAKFFDEKHLYADLVHIVQPSFQIKQNFVKTDNVKRNNESFTFNVQTLKLDSGEFVLIPNLDESLDSIKISGLSTVVNGLDYPRKDPFESGSFYSSDLNFLIEEVTPYLGSKDKLTFQNIEYVSSSNNINIDSVHFKSFNESLEFRIPSISLKNFNTEKWYLENVFELDTLLVQNPSGFNVAAETKANSKPFVIPIIMDHLALEKLQWNYSDTLEKLNLNFPSIDLTIDNIVSKDTFELANFKENVGRLKLTSGVLEVPLPDNYSISTSGYELKYPENSLVINDFKLTSAYSAETYSQRLEYQNDWFDVGAKSITLNKIDIEAIIKDQFFIVESISLNELDALIYRDKGVPFPEDQIRDLPQKTIRQITTPFAIDTLSVSGLIRYREKPEDYFTHGEIFFSDMQAQLFNIGNLDDRLNGLMVLEAEGKLMGVGKFDVKGVFEMKSADNQFSLGGEISDFPLVSMNRMLGPVANVNIKSGFAKELSFNFNANNTLARGDMRFRYNDLKLQILNVKTHDTQGFGQGIKTFFANTFVVKNKNPSYLLFLRKGTVFAKRDTSRAIFNYWGKSLLSGVVSSVGVHKSDKAEKKFERNKD